MTLSFSQKWGDKMGDLKGQPNHFISKIWTGLLTNTGHISSTECTKYYEEHEDKFGYAWDGEFIVSPKIHTIREDKANMWRIGKKIHFVINNRTKDRFQFAPVVKCRSVQKIAIKYVDNPKWNNRFIDADPWIYKDYDKKFQAIIEIDNRGLNITEMTSLATNDGFPSVEAFFDFFKNEFKGKIIHWTDKKY